MNIILASASPRRRELMNLITDNFKAVPADVDETVPDNCTCEVSAYLAELKADKASEMFPDSVVIGCDTVVKINGQILGKPHNAEECRKFLSMLSGKVHTVTTSCCITGFGKKIIFSDNTSVTFRELSDDDIEWYISTGEPFDKAGGYGIQGKGSLLVQGINGDFFNVVGLPVAELNQQIKIFMKSIENQ
ncbi:MAG: Maf family protein [Ruminococcus sp.]|nr:Maf family protein [Ruminococcus sp.]